MEVRFLNETEYVNPETGFLCRYVKSDTEVFAPHHHNYYEIFLMLKGDATHIVNGTSHTLSPGNLLFIRDFDLHEYVKSGDNAFDFINLAFSKAELQSLCDYIGIEFHIDSILKLPLPPVVSLTETEKNKVYFALSELMNTENTPLIKIKFKRLLLDLFTSYFLNYEPENSPIPFWLFLTYEKMKKPQNFIGGMARMCEISGKSREHLSRSLKQFYNTTPTELILDLRLNHCVNLLLSSNLSVTDICYECGFGNVSWFYKTFTKKFGVSPRDYRMQHQWKKE